MLDALAHRQRTRGIPAIAINWGTWGEVGLAAAVENRGARIALQGLKPLTRKEGAELVLKILTQSPVQIAAMHLDAGQWCASHPAAAKSAFFANLTSRPSTAASGAEDSAAGLELLTNEEMRVWLRRQVAAVLRLDVERVPDSKPLRSLGLDSLMALELRNRLERALKLKLSATLVWNYPTISALAGHLVGRLAASHPEQKQQKLHGEPVVREATIEPSPAAVSSPNTGGLSVAEMLEAELLGAESLLNQ
jgi:acyl carrier protein